MKPPKNLYIIHGCTGVIKPEWPIHFYEFIGRNSIPIDIHTAIRIKSPSDLLVRSSRLFDLNGKLIRIEYTPCDTRRLDSMEWTPIVRINGKWVERYDLKYCKSFDDYNLAMRLEGYTPVPMLGYLTPAQHQKWVNRGLKNIQQHACDKALDIDCL